jgi:hypothetical protein
MTTSLINRKLKIRKAKKKGFYYSFVENFEGECRLLSYRDNYILTKPTVLLGRFVLVKKYWIFYIKTNKVFSGYISSDNGVETIEGLY